jgi:hypothetical protein
MNLAGRDERQASPPHPDPLPRKGEGRSSRFGAAGFDDGARDQKQRFHPPIITALEGVRIKAALSNVASTQMSGLRPAADIQRGMLLWLGFANRRHSREL